MATKLDVLAAAAARIDALPTYGKNPAAVYIHPTETTGLREVSVFPTVIVAESLEPNRDWVPRTFGTGTDYWHIAVTVYLQQQVVEVASPAAADMLDKHVGWPQAIASTFVASSSLGGKVDHLGDDARLMRYMIGIVKWNSRPYWGLHASIPVAQTFVQAAGP